jgi:ribosomal protein S20
VVAIAAGALFLWPSLQARAEVGFTSPSEFPVIQAALGNRAALAADLHGRGGGSARLGENDTYLAEALGITVEELTTARTAAAEKALDQAVADGWLTQKQADALKARGVDGRGSFGHFKLWEASEYSIDFDALLADELGISVDELEAAKDAAIQAQLQAAVSDGSLTQAQADLLLAQHALHGYVEKGALQAEALGMSLDEYQAARQDGKTTADLLTEKGLTSEQFRTNLETAYQAVLDKAVAEGVITQAQADLLSQQGVPGRGLDGAHPGRGMDGLDGRMPGGRHGHGDFAPHSPETAPTQTSPTSNS